MPQLRREALYAWYTDMGLEMGVSTIQCPDACLGVCVGVSGGSCEAGCGACKTIDTWCSPANGNQLHLHSSPPVPWSQSQTRALEK